MRLIDADALKAHYAWWGDFPEDGPNRIEEKKIFDTIVNLQPTVDPVRRGKWLLHGEPPWYVRECSLCHEKTHHWSGYEMPHFCGNCGARMEE